MNNKAFKQKDQVYWKWLGRQIRGHVVEVYFKPTTKMIKGKNIKRNGSKECPAYLVQAEFGNLALKLHTEIFPQQTGRVQKIKPKMFSN